MNKMSKEYLEFRKKYRIEAKQIKEKMELPFTFKAMSSIEEDELLEKNIGKEPGE